MTDNLLDTENGDESTISQEEVNNSSLYLDEKDSRGIHLLKRIEKYPNLPEDEFVSIDCGNSNYNKLLLGKYEINKLGQIRNVKTKLVLSPTKEEHGYTRISLKIIPIMLVHRLVAFTFLVNPDIKTYCIVNHIDHVRDNNKLSNLEWVTFAENGNRDKGKYSNISENKLMQYIAIDEDGNELFMINKINNRGYNVKAISTVVCSKCKYKGYYWKRSRLSRKEVTLNLIGYSGNIDDYEWYEHWKYPDVYVCKEGFIRKGNKILCTPTKEGYININIGKGHGKTYRAHRVIAEFIIGRDLEEGEVVDHINTIKHDNSFSNLRITNSIGNMNNPLTVNKITKRKIIASLYGDYIGYYSPKELFNIIGRHKNEIKRLQMFDKVNVIDKKYICILPGDKEMLYKKMSTVTYVFSSDKKKVLGAYFKNLDKISGMFGLSKSTIQAHIKTGKPLKTGEYILKGPEAVELVLSFGHGTAANFNPDDDKDNN